MKRGRILFVDGNERLRALMTAFLEGNDFSVTVVDCGEAAIDVLISQPPFDLLLTDLRLPQLDGVALAHKALRIQSDLPILFVTGRTMFDSMRNPLPGLKHLSQESDSDTLLESVTRALRVPSRLAISR